MQHESVSSRHCSYSARVVEVQEVPRDTGCRSKTTRERILHLSHKYNQAIQEEWLILKE